MWFRAGDSPTEKQPTALWKMRKNDQQIVAQRLTKEMESKKQKAKSKSVAIPLSSMTGLKSKRLQLRPECDLHNDWHCLGQAMVHNNLFINNKHPYCARYNCTAESAQKTRKKELCKTLAATGFHLLINETKLTEWTRDYFVIARWWGERGKVEGLNLRRYF